jgi:dipeptide/tripeptide permease
MWRRLHVLGPVQSLVLASVSAASIALPLAAQSVSRDQTALVPNLFWPDTINPYVTFSLIFIGVMPALIGYYHLGRLGFALNVAAGFALAWIMAVCGILCFVVGHHFGSVWVSTVAYAACMVLAYLLIARLHLGAAESSSVRDAQRTLHLLPPTERPSC